MLRRSVVAAVGFAALLATAAAPAEAASTTQLGSTQANSQGKAPHAQRLKITIDKLTTPIFLQNIYMAGLTQAPAVSVTGVFARCIQGADYGASVTLEQDGRILTPLYSSPGAGVFQCDDPAGSRVGGYGIYDVDGLIHPGRVRVTMTLYSYSTDAAPVSVSRWVTIPASSTP